MPPFVWNQVPELGPSERGFAARTNSSVEPIPQFSGTGLSRQYAELSSGHVCAILLMRLDEVSGAAADPSYPLLRILDGPRLEQLVALLRRASGYVLNTSGGNELTQQLEESYELVRSLKLPSPTLWIDFQVKMLRGLEILRASFDSAQSGDSSEVGSQVEALLLIDQALSVASALQRASASSPNVSTLLPPGFRLTASRPLISEQLFTETHEEHEMRAVRGEEDYLARDDHLKRRLSTVAQTDDMKLLVRAAGGLKFPSGSDHSAARQDDRSVMSAICGRFAALGERNLILVYLAPELAPEQLSQIFGDARSEQFRKIDFSLPSNLRNELLNCALPFVDRPALCALLSTFPFARRSEVVREVFERDFQELLARRLDLAWSESRHEGTPVLQQEDLPKLAETAQSGVVRFFSLNCIGDAGDRVAILRKVARQDTNEQPTDMPSWYQRSHGLSVFSEIKRFAFGMAFNLVSCRTPSFMRMVFLQPKDAIPYIRS